MLLVLKCPWRVAVDAPRHSNFFTGWQKVDAQQKWKLLSSTHPILLPARMAPISLVPLYEKKAKQMATIPYPSEGIVKGPRNQSSTSSATMLSSIVIIVFCCSIREGEKRRLKILVFWPLQLKEKGRTKSSYKHNKYYVYSIWRFLCNNIKRKWQAIFSWKHTSSEVAVAKLDKI